MIDTNCLDLSVASIRTVGLPKTACFAGRRGDLTIATPVDDALRERSEAQDEVRTDVTLTQKHFAPLAIRASRWRTPIGVLPDRVRRSCAPPTVGPWPEIVTAPPSGPRSRAVTLSSPRSALHLSEPEDPAQPGKRANRILVRQVRNHPLPWASGHLDEVMPMADMARKSRRA